MPKLEILIMHEGSNRAGSAVGWILVAVGVTLTVLAFVDRPPLSTAFSKLEPEVIVRPKPVAPDFAFVKAPYPYDRTPWPYERLPGGVLKLREGAR